MKQAILSMPSLALVMAAMASPAVSMAAPNLYGNVHLSLNQADNSAPGTQDNRTLSSNTSSIGVKGSEEFGDGFKAIYKIEFLVNLLDPATTVATNDPVNPAPREGQGGLDGRDQFVGLKGGLGIIKVGTMSTNYKQTGAKVDPLYRTPLEARGFLNMQSLVLHDSRRGMNSGRQTNTVQYVSPKMSGIRIVANTTLSGSNSESRGIGVRWQDKSLLVFADWISSQTGDVTNNGQAVAICDATTNCTEESAYKVGGRYRTADYFFSVQYEAAENRTGGNYLYGSTYYNFNKNNRVILSLGRYSAKNKVTDVDSMGYAVAYNHKLSKLSNVYFGYGLKTDDIPDSNVGMFTLGIRKKF